VGGPSIEGHAEPGFGGVADAFRANLAAGLDGGAGLCVYAGGRQVLNLAGSAEGAGAFGLDSLLGVASCTKGAAAVVVHRLVEQGILDLDAPVCRYWPEFSEGDKEAVTLRWVMSHRAGVPFPSPEVRRPGGSLLEDCTRSELIGASRPWWEPGSKYAYHAVTYGTILGEVVRRVAGKSLGALFAEQVAQPLGLRFWVGAPESVLEHISAPDPVPASTVDAAALAGAGLAPDSLAGRLVLDLVAVVDEVIEIETSPRPERRREWFGREVPASNGVADASALARLYGACMGELDGIRALSPETVAAATEDQTAGVPHAGVGEGGAFGLGFQLPPEANAIGPGCFGHDGLGGRVGLASPSTGIAVGFVCTRLWMDSVQPDPRWATLRRAILDAS